MQRLNNYLFTLQYGYVLVSNNLIEQLAKKHLKYN